ncbi:MAG: hypothetical protein RLZZ546_2181 [Bacteroidota bacterium]|jgi:cell shape-determining protein MreD
MSKFIFGNFVLQVFGGIILIIFPQFLFEKTPEIFDLHLTRFIGVQALIIGVFLYIWYRNQNLKYNFLFRFSITLYHLLAFAFMFFLHSNQYNIILAASLTHLLMFVIWILYIFINLKHGYKNY